MLIDCEQRGSDWLKMRCGSATGSRIADVMTKRKDGKISATRESYKRELVIERLTENTADHFVNSFMEWGESTEPLALAAYEIETGVEPKQIGLATHPTIKYFSASPDALLGEDGVLEAKCLKSENHLDILLSGEIPADYHWQMYAEMACAERKWCDFVSFDPRLPRNLQLFIRRFYWDTAKIAEMELEVVKFLAETDEMITSLKQAKMVEIGA